MYGPLAGSFWARCGLRAAEQVGFMFYTASQSFWNRGSTTKTARKHLVSIQRLCKLLANSSIHRYMDVFFLNQLPEYHNTSITQTEVIFHADDMIKNVYGGINTSSSSLPTMSCSCILLASLCLSLLSSSRASV